MTRTPTGTCWSHLNFVHELHSLNDAHSLALLHTVTLLHKWRLTRGRAPAHKAVNTKNMSKKQQGVGGKSSLTKWRLAKSGAPAGAQGRRAQNRVSVSQQTSSVPCSLCPPQSIEAYIKGLHTSHHQHQCRPVAQQLTDHLGMSMPCSLDQHILGVLSQEARGRGAMALSSRRATRACCPARMRRGSSCSNIQPHPDPHPWPSLAGKCAQPHPDPQPWPSLAGKCARIEQPWFLCVPVHRSRHGAGNLHTLHL